MASKGISPYKMLSGHCPDAACNTKLFFPGHDTSIECTNCGQRHHVKDLKNTQEVVNTDVAVHNFFKNILLEHAKLKKSTDSVKVLGLSNYQCKLLSPLLTYYGMDKSTGKAKLLSEMGQGDKFDCGIIGERTFLIEPEHIETMGYGRDRTGSMNYLGRMLEELQKFNNDEERLLPIHADGDGHCLVHALSRALVGRELFWHPLRDNLHMHIRDTLEKYKKVFGQFTDENEWQEIINESDPDFIPAEGEQHGLRNLHIFGLANVIRRPIVLLDSMEGIQSSGDYTGIFLPAFVDPDFCRGKDGKLNKPLCLSWSSSGRNHYIALVPVKGRPLPKLPPWMTPKCWGMPDSLMSHYIELDEKGCLTLGGEKTLQDKYLLRLASAMEKVFEEKNGVSPALVADVHQYVYRSQGMTWIKPELVLDTTRRAVEENRLYRCLVCDAISEFKVVPELLQPGGSLYSLATREHGKLQSTKRYSFPTQGLICSYDAVKDELVPDLSKSRLTSCKFCEGTQLRLVNGDGSMKYLNGDRTTNRSSSTKCRCGFKHYWDGKEYDNMPEVFPVTLEWNGQVVGEKVYWFQYESDPSMNSNVYEVAQGLVQKHFPGEFGSERLVQRVVDTILRQTARHEIAEKPGDQPEAAGDGFRADTSTKIILTGQKQKTFHKEELTMSKTEKNIKKQIEERAAVTQKKRTDELARIKSSPKKQEPVKHEKKSEPSATVTAGPSSPKGKVPSSGDPKKKVIRVTTSDGKQTTISLDGEISYSQLADRLQTEFELRAEQIGKIRYGFPPKELKKPEDGDMDASVPLNHGDRVTLEVLQLPTEETQPQASTESIADRLSGTVQALQEGSVESIDASVASLQLMAALMGQDMWTYVQTMPHLFSKGGIFYNQFQRDLGLVDGKHCSLPAIPGKIFRYNVNMDRLELCMEPHGHFPVEPDVEVKALSGQEPATHQSGLPMIPEEVQQALQTAASGVVHDPTMHTPSPTHVPFSGQGHSLVERKEDIKMPGDLPQVHHTHTHTPADVAKAYQMAIIEDDEEFLYDEDDDDDVNVDNDDSDDKEDKRMDTDADKSETVVVAVVKPFVDESVPPGDIPDPTNEDSATPVKPAPVVGASGDVAMETDAATVTGTQVGSGDQEPLFKRIGPGYTVLNERAVSNLTEAKDSIEAMVTSIEETEKQADGDLKSDSTEDMPSASVPTATEMEKT